MKIFSTLLMWCFFGIQLGYGQCDLMLEEIEIYCDYSDTPTDPTDDIFYALVEITGSSITEDNGTFEFGPYLIVNGPHELVIVDEGITDCSESILLSPPPCDPPPCEIVATQIGDLTVFDNNTPNQCSDDNYVLTLNVSGFGVTSPGGWRVVFDNGSLSGIFPYDEDVYIDFMPVYDGCGRLIESFRIIDAFDISCLTTIDTSEPSIVSVCDCEAILCYTVGAFNDNGTPSDCTDDFVELSISSNFISPLGTQYELFVDANSVHTAAMSETEAVIVVPATQSQYTLWLQDRTNTTCFTSELLPAFGECEVNSSFSITLGDVEGCAGEFVCVPVTADEFENIKGFQGSMNYDTEVLLYNGVQNLTPLLPGFNLGNFGHPGPGDVTFTWSNPLNDPLSLTDETILVELCFDIVSESNTPTSISFSDSPTVIEVVSGEELEIIPTLNNGQVFCQCLANNECNLLEGRVLSSNDCFNGESTLGNWLIEVSGEDYLEYRYANSEGDYSIYLPQGEFIIRLIPVSDAWTSCEPDGYAVSFSTSGESRTFDLLAQAVDNCTLLEVSMGVGILRRCFEDQIIAIRYDNVGTLPLENGLIGLILPEELTYSSTNGTYLGMNGDTLLFGPSLPLAIGASAQFEVYVDVSCDAWLGSTLCVTALSLPYGPCPAPDDAWLGGSLAVTGKCTGEEVVFTLRNVGDNTLSDGNSYIIIQDGVMLFEMPEDLPPLLPGEDTQINLPANGTTYRIEATQEPFHPGLSYPTAVVEGCGTNEDGGFSIGFISQFPNDEEDAFIDEDCRTVTGSYDPNDKQAEPVGYAEQHYILPEQLLEYTIRFQNTGNDTAFTVVIRDTLSDWLDVSTFRPGVSSHPYELSMDSAHAVTFTFRDILLPDSTTNFTDSQGFIEYKIRPKATAPLETRIENTAAIYFDFNEPVITNTTDHQVGVKFIELINWVSHHSYAINWQLFPNPTTGRLTIQCDASGPGTQIRIFDVFGRQQAHYKLSGQMNTIDVSGLSPGWYSIQLIHENGTLLGSGKLIRE